MFNIFRQPYLSEDTGASEPGAATQSTETVQQQTTTETQQQATEQPKIKVKYNHQEMELPYEEAVAHIQKGMNYEKAIERAKQEAAQETRDKQITELAQEQGWVDYYGNPITTEAQYKQAVKDNELASKIKAQYSEMPDELLQEFLESKKDREERAREKQEQEKREKQQSEYLEFLSVYKKKTGKSFDSDSDILPPEVLDMANKGKSLADAYTIWHSDSKDARIAELEAKIKAFETNQSNAATSPGSVTGNGAAPADFISFETFEANKSNSNWVKQNYTTIMESRAKW